MSLIECLANQECADKLRIAQGRYTVEDVVRYDHKLDTWTVYASSGEHQVEGENLGHAYLRFTESHPDDFVQAIINTEAEVTTNLKADEYAHRADYPGTYTSCARCACPCGDTEHCGCNDPNSPHYLAPGRGINE